MKIGVSFALEKDEDPTPRISIRYYFRDLMQFHQDNRRKRSKIDINSLPLQYALHRSSNPHFQSEKKNKKKTSQLVMASKSTPPQTKAKEPKRAVDKILEAMAALVSISSETAVQKALSPILELSQKEKTEVIANRRVSLFPFSFPGQVSWLTFSSSGMPLPVLATQRKAKFGEAWSWSRFERQCGLLLKTRLL